MVTISIDETLLVQIANFLVLMLALNYLLYRPIRKILAERKALFDQLRNRAAAAKAQMEQGEEEQARAHAESLRLAMEAKNAIKVRAQKEEKDLLTAAQNQAARELEAAREEVRRESAAARERLAGEAKIIAWEMAGKVLGRTL